MVNLKRLLLCIILFASPSYSEPVIGQDYLALQSKYFAKQGAMQFLAGPVATGNLDNTFSSDTAPVATLLSVVQPKFHRVHLIDGPCIRNNNCGPYEIGKGFNKVTFSQALERGNPKIISYLKARALEYKVLSDRFPGVQFLVSPELEHDLSIKAFRNAADAVLSVWPNAQLVNCPDGGVAIERYKNALIERHGSAPQRDADVVSLDGADATDIDIAAFLKRTSGAKVVFLWTAGYNCRTQLWEDPRARQNCPSNSTFELMAHLKDPVPAAPADKPNGCKTLVPFRNPDIWKPLAEYAPKDPRSFLPVMISKFPKGALNIVAKNGVKVGSLGFYATYLDKGFRWYSGFNGGSKDGGYSFQKKAQTVSGSPYVYAQVGNQCKGPFLPGRRQGLYR